MSTLIGINATFPETKVSVNTPFYEYSSWGNDEDFKVRFFKEYLGKYQLPYKGSKNNLPVSGSSGIRKVLVESKKSSSLLAVECGESVVNSALDSDEKIQGFIICHTSIDHDVRNNESTALRFQSVFNEAKLSFSLSSQDGNNFFTSLKVVRAIQAAETNVKYIVVAAAERWPEPFPRLLGNATCLSDGAAAVLFNQNDTDTGWLLQDVFVKSVADFPDPWKYCEISFDNTLYIDQMVDAISTVLKSNNLSSSEIDSVVPPHLNLPLINEVNRKCGFNQKQLFMSDFGETGYFCSADPIVRLNEAINAINPAAKDHLILVWGLGLSGHFGCALFKYMDKDYD